MTQSISQKHDVKDYLIHPLLDGDNLMRIDGRVNNYTATAHLGAFISPDNCFIRNAVDPSTQPIFLITFSMNRIGYTYCIITDGEKYARVKGHRPEGHSGRFRGDDDIFKLYRYNKSIESKKQVCDAINKLIKSKGI